MVTIKDKQKVRSFLNSAYAIFLSRVKEGRGHIITETKTIENVADGSAYTAEEALANGLIDGIGYLSDAIAVAKTQSNLENTKPTILRYSPRQSGFGGILGATSTPLTSNRLKTLLHELSSPDFMYLFN